MLFSTRDTWDYRRHGPLGLFRTRGGHDSLPFHNNTLTSSGDLEAKLLQTIHTYTYLFVFFVDFSLAHWLPIKTAWPIGNLPIAVERGKIN